MKYTTFVENFRMNHSTTNQVFMVRPVNFKFNLQTAADNAFQTNMNQSDEIKQQQAAQEFDDLVEKLRKHGVQVEVVNDKEEANTPDSIFPNNWISTHQGGEMVLYPMYAENRRKEVRQETIDFLAEKYGYEEILDWTTFTKVDQFLEGTGSLVLDRKSKIAYACLSERTNLELALNWGSVMDYELVTFSAVDQKQRPIYHTNVMMTIGEHFAVVCLDCIPNEQERNQLRKHLEFTDKEIIPITFKQVDQFAGNMIELKNDSGEHLLVLSQAAYDSLTEDQINQLQKHAKLIITPIPTIENNGGGSVRCMIAELF